MTSPRSDRVMEALQIRLGEQQALAEWSWMVAALQGGGDPQARKEVAIRQSIYIQLHQKYMEFCREHSLCQVCNGDGDWENEPGVIGPCKVCGGSGRAKEVKDE